MNRPADRTTLAVVAGWRTPLCRAGTDLESASAGDLAAHVLRETLDRTGWDAARVDEVVLGCAGPEPREANVARVAALRAGIPHHVPAVTVMRNCASGMESLREAQLRLLAGRGEVFLVGGTESMSNFPLLMGPQLVRMLTGLQKARSLPQRLRNLLGFRPSMLAPRISILEGLTDGYTGQLMGETAETLARTFGIDRAQQDAWALRSHQRAAAAAQSGRLAAEIAPLVTPRNHAAMVSADNGIRTEQTLEALQRLRPVFDRRDGDVTVGNACQVTDGAVALLVMSLERARAEGLRPMAVVRSTAVAGLDPRTMGLGPVHALLPALREAGCTIADLETVEVNEAFAAQVLACVHAAGSPAWCREHLGLPGALGEIDLERLNPNGGAIALGHPIAASGARLVLTLAHELRSGNKQLGAAALCVGGGQGEAVVLEAA
ncbi:MAG: hypothetical protein RL148_1674 [Planctomycetota bacterium]